MIQATLQNVDSEDGARRALEEIERLVQDAAASGVKLDPWIAELAEELRAAVPAAGPEDVMLIVRRIAQDPRVSLAAQSRLRSETVSALKG